MNLKNATPAEVMAFYEREEFETEKAHECGMDVDDWRRNRKLTRDSKARGKRTPEDNRKLANWGSVEGQLELFAE
jgi:hypothetical protein